MNLTPGSAVEYELVEPDSPLTLLRGAAAESNVLEAVLDTVQA